MTFCFYNGAVVTKNQLNLSIDDFGFSRGYALFEHCRTYCNKPFHLQDHLVRLLRGAHEFLLPLPYSFEAVEQAVHLLIHNNGFAESGLKFYLTAGVSSDGFTLPSHPTWIIYPYPLLPYQRTYPQRGLILKTTEWSRAFPHCKTTFYLPGFLAKRKNLPCDEILFLDKERHLLESSTAGFLAFIEDTLIVPEGELLPSVTQEVLVMLAGSLFKVERRPIAYSELPYLTEAFLCSTTREVLPIASIDSHTIGTIANYKNTLRLKEAFTHYVLSQQWPVLAAFHEEAISLR